MVMRASFLVGTVVLVTMLGSCPAFARDSKVIREFKREVPCPATDKRRGACPGYHADHLIALCAGGADHWANMQWLTHADHKEKTRSDVRVCAALRKRPQH